MRSFLLTYSLLFVIFCSLFSCRGDMEDEKMLSGLDSLVEYHTDSAYQLLTAIQPRVDSLGSKATSMRHLMLLTSARNKLDRLSPSDTTFVDVVDYYDRHGSRNDQMKARYLLGCIYKEMGESPLAITTFESAVDCADTLAPDCDWLTLLSIHGQAATTYIWQFNPVQEFVEGEKYCQCALKLGNEREYAIGLEIMEHAAESMNDSVKGLYFANKCREVYLKLGLNQDAAKECLFPMLYYVERKMWNQAEELIEFFENSFPINDSSSDDQVVERYHYVKGMLYLGKGQAEDAEREFRVMSLSDFGYYRNRGLLQLYRKLGNADSTAVYSMRCENSIGKALSRRETTSLAAASANYKYDRIAGKEAEERHKAGLFQSILLIVMALVLLSLLGWWLWMRHKHKEVERLRGQIHNLSETIEQKAGEIDKLRKNYDAVGLGSQPVTEKLLEKIEHLEKTGEDGQASELRNALSELQETTSYILKMKDALLSAKTAELGQLFEQMNRLYASMFRLLPHKRQDDSSDGGIINLLHKKGSGLKKTSTITDEEFSRLESTLASRLPNLTAFIKSVELKPEEKIVCYLTIMGFRGKEISILLDKPASRISSYKSHANIKLFGDESSKDLKVNLLAKSKEDDD